LIAKCLGEEATKSFSARFVRIAAIDAKNADCAMARFALQNRLTETEIDLDISWWIRDAKRHFDPCAPEIFRPYPAAC
jgi:hypothetical protein